MTPFDWRFFLQLADWLDERLATDATIPGDEAGPRTVISRAYYAAFHVARAFVDGQVRAGDLLWPGTHRSIHDKVWEALKAHPDSTIVDLANKGERLKQLRTEADYSVAPNKRRAAIADQARQYARDIISGLDALAPTTT